MRADANLFARPHSPSEERPRRGSRVRSLWQAPVVRDELEPLPPAHQASLEPQHPTGAGARQRFAPPTARVHLVPARRQGREASPALGSHAVGLSLATGTGLVLAGPLLSRPRWRLVRHRRCPTFGMAAASPPSS